MSSQKNKTNILITGVTSGIGLAIVKKLTQKSNFRVFGCARRREKLEDLQRELGEQFIPYVCDVKEEEQILHMFEDIEVKFGGVDIMINNAGLGHKASLIDGNTEYWREMLDINVLALCICTREAISQMRKHGDEGYIIHVSSMSAHRVPSSSGMYSATKFAVRSLTEGLRQELRQLKSNIRISSISPGFVETEFAQKYHRSEKIAQEIYGQYSVLQAEDIADQILFMIESPRHVQIHDILLRPTHQDN
jgi:17beta-estradiol 17-dehydrogenase / 3beta-hydroxysteroid 3-dehydrogenase